MYCSNHPGGATRQGMCGRTPSFMAPDVWGVKSVSHTVWFFEMCFWPGQSFARCASPQVSPSQCRGSGAAFPSPPYTLEGGVQVWDQPRTVPSNVNVRCAAGRPRSGAQPPGRGGRGEGTAAAGDCGAAGVPRRVPGAEAGDAAAGECVPGVPSRAPLVAKHCIWRAFFTLDHMGIGIDSKILTHKCTEQSLNSFLHLDILSFIERVSSGGWILHFCHISEILPVFRIVFAQNEFPQNFL